MNEDEERLLRRLQRGLVALGLEPQALPCAAYLRYLGLLEKWNRAYNLTAVRDREKMISAHILDSLSALPYSKGPRCLDVGSGAGLPGFVIALARPEQRWTLLDSNGKKTRFLSQLSLEMGVDNIEVAQARAEKFLSSAPYSFIISRAFGSLGKLMDAVEHLIRPGVRVVAMKGKAPDEELRAVEGLKARVSVQAATIPGMDAERNLVIFDA